MTTLIAILLGISSLVGVDSNNGVSSEKDVVSSDTSSSSFRFGWDWSPDN